jgi:hypothetical protein
LGVGVGRATPHFKIPPSYVKQGIRIVRILSNEVGNGKQI